MARKTDKSESAHGLSYVIGVTLLAAALFLFVAQWSFARGDLAVNQTPPNSPTHNHAGWLGAQVAHGFFFLLGAGAYLLPVALVVLGLGCWFEWLAYLRRRWPWLLILLLSGSGLLHLANTWPLGARRDGIGAPYLGGFAGYLNYDAVSGWYRRRGHPLRSVVFHQSAVSDQFSIGRLAALVVAAATDSPGGPVGN